MHIEAVLFDRDDTLVVDVPYNGDPGRVVPVPGGRAALDRLRAAGLRIGVVSNQSGIARGLLTAEQANAVNRRAADLLGGFDTVQVCPHDDAARCGCRKPRPGLVLAAAAALGVPADHCVVVGDIGADVTAAQAAGATGILVPTRRTRPAEVAAAPVVLPDLAAAVDWILGGAHHAVRATRGAAQGTTGKRVLVVRADSEGDVLLTGPAVRAVAARAAHVTLLCSARGRQAAELLPGVDEILMWTLPWLDPEPPPVTAEDMTALGKRIEAGEYDEALVVTSYHQSPLPTALLLRQAGVPHIAAISEDYPGALLDVRHRAPTGVPEAERALSLAAAAGYPCPDDGRLAIRRPLPDVTTMTGEDPYVVVHPGTSVPARAYPPDRCAAVVERLGLAGRRVLVTGAPGERALTGYVAGRRGVDLGGRTSLAELAAVLAGADALVVGNTGPAHLAAAVGTPVVSLFAPTVPYSQWGPYGVPAVRLGDADAPCAGSRARLCPVPGHPCLSTVDPRQVVTAVEELRCAS